MINTNSPQYLSWFQWISRLSKAQAFFWSFEWGSQISACLKPSNSGTYSATLGCSMVMKSTGKTPAQLSNNRHDCLRSPSPIKQSHNLPLTEQIRFCPGGTLIEGGRRRRRGLAMAGNFISCEYTLVSSREVTWLSAVCPAGNWLSADLPSCL